MKQFETIGIDLSENKIANYRNFRDPTGDVSAADLRAASRVTARERAAGAGSQRYQRADPQHPDGRVDLIGPGLMIGVEFVEDRATRVPDGSTPDALIARCADDGLLLLTCGSAHQVVRWIAPLDVTSAEVSEALEIFGDALAGLPRSGGGAGD